MLLKDKPFELQDNQTFMHNFLKTLEALKDKSSNKKQPQQVVQNDDALRPKVFNKLKCC